MLILRPPRTSQPQQPIAPDRAFDVLLLPPAGVGDQATNAWPTIGAGGTFAQRASRGGQSFYFSGGSAQVSLPRLIYTSDRITSLFGTRSQTVVIQTRCISTPFGAVLSCGRPSANNMRFYLSLRNGSGNVEFLTHNGGFQAVSWSGSGISVGEFSTFVLVYNTDGTNGTLRLLKNGRDFGTQNFAASNFPNAAGEVFNFGAANASGLNDNFWGLEAEHTLFAILPGALAPQHAAQISVNPWQLFAPEPRRFWLEQAAAGGVSGTSATTNANDTSSASGSPIIVGTSATTNAADTSTASGTPIIVGTSTTTNANDTSNASGTVGGGVVGTSATTNANDTASASGSPIVNGTSATTNAADAASAAGWAGVVSGTVAVTNANDTAFAEGFIGAEAPRRNTGAGKSKRRRYTVEVDGEEFDVSSPAEAEEVLAKVREQAEQTAAVALERAKAAEKRPTRKVLADARKALVLPEIKVPDEMQARVQETLEGIESLYQSTLQTIEIAALLRKRQQEEEDDEDILLLIA